MDDPFSQNTRKSLQSYTETKKTSKRIYWIFFIVIIIFAISTAVFAALYFINRSKDSKTDKDDLCLTPYCVRAANYLIESINKSVDPCEDFYEFACGSWLEKTRIPDDANVINSFRVLDRRLDEDIIDLLSTSKTKFDNLESVKNARLLYRTCLNETNIELEGIQPILIQIENQLGGWPLLNDSSWNENSFNLSNLFIQLRELNNNFLITLGTETDEQNSSIADITIRQGSLGLPQRQYYQNESSITVAYRDFIKNLAQALSDKPLKNIDEDVQQIYEFEKNISKFYWSSDEQRARDNETIRTSFDKLSDHLQMNFDLKNYLRQTYKFAGITVKDEDRVVLSELEFLRNLSSILEQTPPRILQNYFLWRFLQSQSGILPRKIRTIKEQFDRVFQQTNSEQARTTHCAIMVNNNMGFAVSKIYIEQYFDDNARNQSMNMIESIRSSFINSINQSTWMEQTSKEKAIHKARSMTKQIGYPDYLATDDTTRLEQDYIEYRFELSFFNNTQKLLKIKAREALKLLDKPVDRTAWGSLPPTVINAFYEPSQNQITFPAGILQTPFFDKDAPKYLNYGGIGAVIGHEITHGFDDQGRQYDEEGDRIPWWTQSTIEQFNIKKQCIIDQYSNYSIPTVPLHSNGVQTQGEDIADNGGIKASFFAYQQWAKQNPNQDKQLPGLQEYSPEQLFFMNFAHIWCMKMTDNYAYNRILTDPHSLGPFRVRGPTSNFDQFDQAFKCKPGQGNSRVNKCSVW